MKKIIISLLLIFALTFTLKAEESLSDYLQSISVTVKAGMSSGSGVIVTRELKENKDSEETKPVNFVLTAGHVIDGLKKTNKIIDSKTGQERILVEFDYPKIMQMMIENGRRVGEINLDCKVISFSDSEVGDDLAVLMVMKHGFTDKSAKFYLDKDDVKLGTKILHVGSFLGDFGSNSMSDGIVSQNGRMINNRPYTQLSCAGFPGSSGGGIFLEDGQYIGTLVRGAGENFVLSVPHTRLNNWVKKVGMEWLIDANISPPDLETIMEQPVDDVALRFYLEQAAKEDDKTVTVNNEYKFMIKDENE